MNQVVAGRGGAVGGSEQHRLRRGQPTAVAVSMRWGGQAGVEEGGARRRRSVRGGV